MSVFHLGFYPARLSPSLTEFPILSSKLLPPKRKQYVTQSPSFRLLLVRSLLHWTYRHFRKPKIYENQPFKLTANRIFILVRDYRFLIVVPKFLFSQRYCVVCMLLCFVWRAAPMGNANGQHSPLIRGSHATGRVMVMTLPMGDFVCRRNCFLCGMRVKKLLKRLNRMILVLV